MMIPLATDKQEALHKRPNNRRATGEEVDLPSQHPEMTGKRNSEFRSKMASQESEDPLSKMGSGDFPGMVTGQVTQASYKYSLSYAGLLDICAAEFHRLADTNSEFKKSVPFCIFFYYVIQHFWARICSISDHRGNSLPEAIELIKEFSNKQYPVLSVISAYLRSIGDITDRNVVEAILRLPPFPNARGDFGRVGELTHNFYEAIPAPRIVVELILQSVPHAGEQGVPVNWDLPADIRYEAPMVQQPPPPPQAPAVGLGPAGPVAAPQQAQQVQATSFPSSANFPTACEIPPLPSFFSNDSVQK